MNFVQPGGNDPFYFVGGDLPGYLDSWLSAIDRIWNRKFFLTNGAQNIALVFVPLVVRSHARPIEVHTNENDHCGALSDPNRSTAFCWFATKDYRNGINIAHEFGHLVSAADEYNLPATATEIPPKMRADMNPADIKVSTYEGITGQKLPATPGGRNVPNSLMSEHEKSQDVEARHVQRLVNAINAQLAGIGLPKYVLKKL